MSIQASDVRVGQLWIDNDTRTKYRFVRIVGFDPMGHRDCAGSRTWARVLRTESRDRADMTAQDPIPSWVVVKKAKIRLDRLVKGGVRGYTMIQNVTKIGGSVGHYPDCTLETPECCSCDRKEATQ